MVIADEKRIKPGGSSGSGSLDHPACPVSRVPGTISASKGNADSHVRTGYHTIGLARPSKSWFLDLLESSERALLYLGDHIDVRFNDFGRVKLVVILDPSSQHSGCTLQGIGKRVGDADRHEVFVVFGPRPAHRPALNQINLELDFHRSLERIAGEFSLGLGGMPGAELWQRGGLIDWQVYGSAL